MVYACVELSISLVTFLQILHHNRILVLSDLPFLFLHNCVGLYKYMLNTCCGVVVVRSVIDLAWVDNRSNG
jgi:hypothetical protein